MRSVNIIIMVFIIFIIIIIKFMILIIITSSSQLGGLHRLCGCCEYACCWAEEERFWPDADHSCWLLLIVLVLVVADNDDIFEFLLYVFASAIVFPICNDSLFSTEWALNLRTSTSNKWINDDCVTTFLSKLWVRWPDFSTIIVSCCLDNEIRKLTGDVKSSAS